jgi:hypothetical protein
MPPVPLLSRTVSRAILSQGGTAVKLFSALTAWQRDVRMSVSYG